MGMTRQPEIKYWRFLVMKDRCYNVKDLQEMLEVSRPAVYDLLKRKEFQWVMVGGKYRISKISFDAWLDGGPVPSPHQLQQA